MNYSSLPLQIPRLAAALTIAACILWADSSQADEGRITFEQHIAPILQARCVKCHGEGKLEGGLDLRRKFLLAKGGDSGAALVEGKPEESLLIEKISKGEMPPKEEGKLDDKQIDVIRRWVAAGAPLVGDKEPPLEAAEAPSRITAEDRKFWSFVSPVRPPLPVVKNADRVRTAIDVFLIARLEEKQLSFAPDAPKEVLLRRTTFALHGLPPEVSNLDAFLADNSPDSFERLLDRLQASPRYGEHAARQWLDVAGYADSDGYLAADRLRPQAWRYRDYVIGALNSDLPYDRFLLEQLAGDELSDWRRAEELSPEQARQLAATGFLRTASDPTYPGYTEPNEIHQVTADTTQIVSSALLGLTIQCARCHTHKYDPIPHRDYYALQAIFTPALDPGRWQPSEVRGIPLATEAEQARITQHNQKIDQRVVDLNAELSELTTRFRKKRVTELLGTDGKDATLIAKLTAALLAAADKRNDEQKMLVAKFAAGISLVEADLAKWNSDYQQQSEKLKAVIVSETALKQQIVTLRGLVDMDDKPADCKLLLRGDYNQPGAVIPPNVPEVLAPVSFKFEPKPGYKTTGRREAFGRWLIEPSHPLTARVQVNRMWAKQFGRGIVPTLANFGRSGVKPTHPELLDYLATEFVASGWGQKKLVRQLLSSTAWRQSSTPTALTLAADPNNELLGFWRATRHSGEMLRDSTLAAAGKLNATMFGAPSAVSQQGDGSVITADDASGNRRSVYLMVRRSQHVTMLDLFDVPMMEVNCPQRSASIVPLQALAMLHGPFSEQSAATLADRILREAPASDDARIDYACRLLYSRLPRPVEKEVLTSFLASLTADKLANASTSPTDAQKSDAARAAWVQAALVLLNSNEFLYVH
jgi:mono/diheme cytochrome c family protein